MGVDVKKVLAVERSTASPGVALCEEGVVLYAQTHAGEPARSPEWLAALAQGLDGAGCAMDAIDGFVCGLGPGSFSGIRAALAALQGLALPGDKPVYGVASAAAVALAARECLGRDAAMGVTVVGDARRGTLWAASYLVPGTGAAVRLYNGHVPTQTAADFLLLPPGELAKALPGDTLVVSPDWGRLAEVLSANFQAQRLVTQPLYPSAVALGLIVSDDPGALLVDPLPIYLHPAVARVPR